MTNRARIKSSLPVTADFVARQPCFSDKAFITFLTFMHAPRTMYLQVILEIGFMTKLLVAYTTLKFPDIRMTFFVSIETACAAKELVTRWTWKFFLFGMCADVLF